MARSSHSRSTWAISPLRRDSSAARRVAGAAGVLQLGFDFIGVALADPHAAYRERDVARRELAQIDPGRAHEGGDGFELGVEEAHGVFKTLAIQPGIGDGRGAR